ncbi:MAG: amidohydrolase family protein [Candidatus Nanoarchaeia archaeon]|nr:amidohydrolase family protein [Candidatus Nanoarchaeia archaeon]
MNRIIDFHTHLALQAETYSKVLKKYNIETAVCIPYDFGEFTFEQLLHELNNKPEEWANGVLPKSGNYIKNVLQRLININLRFLGEIKSKKNIIPAPWISPECDGLEDFIENPEIKIIKFIPVLDNATKDYYTQKIIPYVKHAVDNDKLIMIHTGWRAKVKPISKLAEQFPQGKFVIAHMKEDDDFMGHDRFAVLKDNKNVYVETSYGQGPHRIETYVKEGFGKRILFGSDFRTSTSSLEWQIGMINLSEISEEEKQDILYNNAKKLLKI